MLFDVSFVFIADSEVSGTAEEKPDYVLWVWICFKQTLRAWMRVWQMVIDSYRCFMSYSIMAMRCHLLSGSGTADLPGCEGLNQRHIFTIFIFPWSMYGPVMSLEQRHSYQEDFCSEYDEYKDLHSRIATITHMFVQLGSKIKSLSPGTPEHKVHWVLVNTNVSFLSFKLIVIPGFLHVLDNGRPNTRKVQQVSKGELLHRNHIQKYAFMRRDSSFGPTLLLNKITI